MLKERFSPRDLLGVGLAILGAVTVVLSAKSSDPSVTPESLLQAIRQPAFIAYFAVTAAATAGLLSVTHSKSYGNRWIGVDVGICALFGGYTVLATKALSSLLSNLFLQAFTFVITWVMVAVVGVTSVLQIRYLNRALSVWTSKVRTMWHCMES